MESCSVVRRIWFPTRAQATYGRRGGLHGSIHGLWREDGLMPQTLVVPAVPICRARPRLGRLVLLMGLALSLSVVPRVPAATIWTVCASGCDYTSIKAAIAA